jgi:hypothetical protein
MPTLSQLSYGPLFVAQCSGEVEIVGPIDAELLVVVGAVEAKVNLCSAHEVLVGQEKAAVNFLAVGRVTIDLTFDVDPAQQSVSVPSG